MVHGGQKMWLKLRETHVALAVLIIEVYNNFGDQS